MTRDGVIVDTSVLIDFLKDKAPNADAVATLIDSKRIITTGIIIAELLQGARTAREEMIVEDLANALPSLEITSAIWTKAGRISSALRRKGITVPLTDMAIAALAIEHSLSVFTLDSHFEHIPGVRLYKPR